MVGSTRYISNLSRAPPTYVTVADNGHLRTNGQGIVVLQARDSNTHITFNDVLYVPDLRFNLLSAAKLSDCGVTLTTDPYTRDLILTFAPPDSPVEQPILHLYQQQLGCLFFASVTCRPDLSYIASQLAQHSRKPVVENHLDLERALKYFISTPDMGLSYSTRTTTSFNLTGFVDADHAADLANRRSRTDFIFCMKPTGPIS
ncbi:unnamed protein product [Closterium sp. NIES-53]